MIFTEIHYDKNLTFPKKIIKFLLGLFTPVYYFVSEFRNFLYRNNFIKAQEIKDVLVISIGNLTTGGVGKTPIVAGLANYLSQNKKVAILSRGYKSKLNSKEINVISKYGEIFYKAEIGGDEPVWMAENCPKVSVLTSSNRVNIARYAKEKLGSEILILDDGFQHQRLYRNINIIVIDAEKQFGNKSVLPKGPLREGLKNINRADKIVLVNKNFDENMVDSFKAELENKYNKPVIVCNMVVDYIYNIKTGEKLLSGGDVGAFSAIGQPKQFYKYLYNNFNVKFEKDYPDHYSYSEKDIEELKNLADLNQVRYLITTEKDAVKLINLNIPKIEIYALKLKSEINFEELLNV